MMSSSWIRGVNYVEKLFKAAISNKFVASSASVDTTPK